MRQGGNERIKRFFEREDTFENYQLTGEQYDRRRRLLESMSGTAPNDLFIIVFGQENCKPDKQPVFGKHQFYSLHCVMSGAGVLECSGKTHKLKAGDVFIVWVDEYVRYYPDAENPWSYIYIDFGGILQDAVVREMGFDRDRCARRFGHNSPVVDDFRRVYDCALDAGVKSLKTLGALYTLFGDLSDAENDRLYNSKERYVRQAIAYVTNNMPRVTVEDVAANCAVSSAYLTRVCREVLGVSLKECITIYRLRVACNYLRNTKEPLAKISSMLDFSSVKYFIKVFGQTFGVTPAQYRKQAQTW